MQPQEVSITPARQLVEYPDDELFFLNALVEERIAPCPNHDYGSPYLKVQY
jgi:hypothetical protein